MRLFGTKRNAAHVAPKRRKRADKASQDAETPRRQADDYTAYDVEDMSYHQTDYTAYDVEDTPRRRADHAAYDTEDAPRKRTAKGKSGTKNPRKRRIRRIVLISCIALFLLVGGAYAMISTFIRPPEVQPFVPGQPPDTSLGSTQADPGIFTNPDRPSGIYTVVIVGTDSGGGLTDTMMVAAIDTLNGGANVVSIPRDTMIDAPWSVRKINGAFPIGGMDRLLYEMDRLLGFRPDNYVVVKENVFEALVDVLGGIYFDVPVRMAYDDPCQNLHIHFQPGYQHLTGAQALQVVRFRNNNDGSGYIDADIGRIRTQQAFLMTVARELLQVQNITRIPELVNIFVEYVETDLYVGNLIYFATQLSNIDSEEINFRTLPGEYDAWVGGTSYVIVYPEEWIEMVNQYLNPFPSPVGLENVELVARRGGGPPQPVGGGESLTGPRTRD